MRTWTVSLPLVPMAVGDEVDRSAWVPHVTVIGNLRAPDTAEESLLCVVRRFAAATPPVRMAVGEEAWFGPERTVLVDQVASPLLHELHVALLSELEAVQGFAMIEPRHTRAGWRPHRTVTSGPRPTRGDVLEANAVALVELDPPNRPGIAVVRGVWLLGGAPQQD